MCGEFYLLWHFYPRSPCGERRYLVNTYHRIFGISIHALLAESDANWFDLWGWAEYFYPRSPCGERPCITIIIICTASFLSTLSLRRATNRFRNWSIPCNNFYPRSPCGERRQRHWLDSTHRRFLSTLSLRRATIPWLQ